MCVAAVQLVVLQKCLEEATLPLLDPFIYTRGGGGTKTKKKLYYVTVSAAVACCRTVFTNSEHLK